MPAREAPQGSDFDAEILLGERQLSYLILTLIDAGSIPSIFTWATCRRR